MNKKETLTQGSEAKQMTGSQRKSRWRKWLRRLFWSMICLISLFVVLAASYVLITNYRGEIAKKEVLKELKERGLETDHTYLEENEADLPSEDSESPHQKKKSDEVENNGKDGTHLYLAALELSRDSGDFPPIFRLLSDAPELSAPVSNKLTEKLRQYTNQQKDFYSLLREARECDYCSFNLNYLNNPYANEP